MSRSGHGLVRPGGSLRRTTRRTWVDRVHWTTPAWLCVVAALMLTVIGLAAIGTTRPELVPKQRTILDNRLLTA